ncbi:MAG: hypothetical protein HQL69_01870 [Magnetococcales bacterium]|nr:hypothetical protein [Magnetococcales bacterium]
MTEHSEKVQCDERTVNRLTIFTILVVVVIGAFDIIPEVRDYFQTSAQIKQETVQTAIRITKRVLQTMRYRDIMAIDGRLDEISHSLDKEKITFSLWRSESDDPTLRSPYPTKSVMIWLKRKLDSKGPTNAKPSELKKIMAYMKFMIIKEQSGQHYVDLKGIKKVVPKKEFLRRLEELDLYEEGLFESNVDDEELEDLLDKFYGIWWRDEGRGAFTVVTAIERTGICSDCHVNDISNKVYFKFEKKIDKDIFDLQDQILMDIVVNTIHLLVVGILLIFLRSRITDMVGRLKQREISLESQNTELVISMTLAQRAESEMEAARDIAEDATKTKDDFLRLVSHDLRSPLANIITTMEYIRKEVADQQIKEMVLSLEKRSERTLEMIQYLLDIDRLKKGIILVEPVEFHGISYIDDIIEEFYPLSEKKKVFLKNNFPGNLMLYTDPKLLERVLGNLISNAIKFCNAEDQVNISFIHEELPIIVVEDNGVGIQEGMISDLFLRDKVTSRSGTLGEVGHGLGLPLCQDIMKALGGRITVKSVVGEGSRFFVQMPVYAVKILDSVTDSNVELEQLDKIVAENEKFVKQMESLIVKNIEECTAEEKKQQLTFLEQETLTYHANEEIYMERLSFPDFSEHKELHKEYKALLEFVKNGSGTNSNEWDEDMVSALWEWLKSHVYEKDSKFIEFIKTGEF